MRGTRNLRMNIMLVEGHASGVIVGGFDGWVIVGIGPGLPPGASSGLTT